MGRIGALVPDVLRTEGQFRLLFAGQVLSLIGDRVMLVALPFAVLEAGGDIEAVGLVVAAQLVPFLVFALVGGVISDRGDRRRVLIASDVARLVIQAVGGGLLVAGAATPLTLGVLAALYGAADAFFQPAFTGLLPQTVSHPGQLQPANALRGLSFSVSSVAGPTLAGVLVGVHRRRSGAAVRRGVVRGERRVPAAAAPGGGRRGDRGDPAAVPGAVMRRLARGPRRALDRRRPRGDVRLRTGSCSRPSTSSGPVTIAERLGGPGAWAAVVVSFGLGSILGDLLLLRFRPRHALLSGASRSSARRVRRRSTARASGSWRCACCSARRASA